MVFFVTAMGFLLFWAIHSYFLDRQPVLGIFAIHQAVYTLFSISTTGYLAPIMPANLPQLADWFNIILYCSISFTPVLFCRALFKPYAPPPLLMRGLQVLLWSFPVLLLLIALGYDALAVNTCAVLIRISWLYFVGMAFSLRKESTPSRRILQGFFVVILINNLVFWYVNRIGWMAVLVNPSAMQILVVDGLVIGGLFAIILHSRTRQVLREGQQSALELLLVQKKFEIEQELKKRIEVQAQTDYLTGVCNRRRFVELAEHELARANRFQRPFTLLVIDIDHFKSINDTWGHGVGDKVLKEITIRMSGALREADIFGRTGGEEFAAVLVEIEGQDAIEVAQRLCASVAASWIDLPEARGIHASVSIGLAQLNGRDVSFNHLLQEADGAMYSAKQAGRNQVFAEV
jgi:diguanylate cyclase (GGDEF)-like protein